jgi:hypothetical protein
LTDIYIFALATIPLRSTSRSGLPTTVTGPHYFDMGTKSRETLYGSMVRASAARTMTLYR